MGFTQYLTTKQGYVILALFFLCGCATGKNIQPRVNALVVAHQPAQASVLLKEGPQVYASRNELLYWLDLGMTLHFAQEYESSSKAFIKARRLVDQLYGQSSREILSSWLINDSRKQYRGDDNEYVLINIFQALNFYLLGNIDEALVEARDADKQLQLIGSRYKDDQPRVYKDDAFTWMLMGILWEIEGSSTSINDAYIAYQRAWTIYQNQYQTNYGISAPDFLKENLWRTAQHMGVDETMKWQGILGKVNEADVNQGEIYVVQYSGYAPVKVAKSVIVPISVTQMTKLSLADYEDRAPEKSLSMVMAKGKGLNVNVPMYVVEPIGRIAKEMMRQRMAWLTTKGVVRAAGKLAVEYAAQQEIRRRYGDWQADLFSIIGSIYNMFSEEADTRSWQTLPNDIRIAKIKLSPGDWELFIDGQTSLGNIHLKSGEKKIIVVPVTQSGE